MSNPRSRYQDNPSMSLQSKKYPQHKVDEVHRDWVNNHHTQRYLSKHYNIPISTINFWISRWKQELYVRKIMDDA